MPYYREWTLAILRDLAANPDGLSTPELARRHAAGIGARQALTKCGNSLRSLEYHKLVYRAGTVPGIYQRKPATVWRITADGSMFAATSPR